MRHNLKLVTLQKIAFLVRILGNPYGFLENPYGFLENPYVVIFFSEGRGIIFQDSFDNSKTPRRFKKSQRRINFGINTYVFLSRYFWNPLWFSRFMDGWKCAMCGVDLNINMYAQLVRTIIIAFPSSEIRSSWRWDGWVRTFLWRFPQNASLSPDSFKIDWSSFQWNDRIKINKRPLHKSWILSLLGSTDYTVAQI